MNMHINVGMLTRGGMHGGHNPLDHDRLALTPGNRVRPQDAQQGLPEILNA